MFKKYFYCGTIIGNIKKKKETILKIWKFIFYPCKERCLDILRYMYMYLLFFIGGIVEFKNIYQINVSWILLLLEFFFLALKYIDDLQNWNKIISPYFKLKDLDNVYEITSNVTPFVMEQFGKNVVIIDFCFEKMVV